MCKVVPGLGACAESLSRGLWRKWGLLKSEPYFPGFEWTGECGLRVMHVSQSVQWVKCLLKKDPWIKNIWEILSLRKVGHSLLLNFSEPLIGTCEISKEESVVVMVYSFSKII